MPSQSAKAVNYAFTPVQPKYRGVTDPVVQVVNLQPSTTYVAGTVMAYITNAANDVQTVTITGTPTGGNFSLTGTNPLTGRTFITATLAYNATNTTVSNALVNTSVYGAGNVTVSGSAGGPYTITGAAALASMPIPILALSANNLSGGTTPSATFAHTTVGRTGGTYGAYASAVAAPPTVAVPTGTGSSGAFTGGDYFVQLTGVNASGETTVSPGVIATLTNTQSLHIASITGLDTSFTSLNVYVEGTLVGSCAISPAGTSTATNFTGGSLSVKGVPPQVNTAYTISGGAGSNKAVGVLIYSCQTDAAGQISYSSTNATGEWGQTSDGAPIFVGDTYLDVSVLTGLDAKAVSDLGRLVWGTTSVGELKIL